MDLQAGAAVTLSASEPVVQRPALTFAADQRKLRHSQT
jgi:hypothetical protein